MTKAVAAGSRGTAKPNLFIVGAPKCGTTAWRTYLASHPDIFFSDAKEPNYFSPDLPGIRWIRDFDEYERLFARGSDKKFRGEASAIYMYSTAAARGIFDYNPDARILIFLRDQEDFLPSWHHQMLYKFAENIEDFEQAWRLSGHRPQQTIPKTCREPKMLDYAAVADFRAQVDRFLDLFPRDQMLVINFRDWTADPRSTYLRVLDFLGLEDDGRSDFPRLNEAKRFQIEWIGRLIAQPPKFAMDAVRLLRKIVGRDSLGIGERAANLLATQGYTTSISAELRAEIRSRYAEDNKRLRDRLTECDPVVG